METAPHRDAEPSAWVQRWQHLLSPGATVLDVACGHGRHVRWLEARGCRVTALDRDSAALAPLREVAEVCVADIEGGPWPLAGRRFAAVICTNYLWRPLFPQLVAAVAEGGALVYETFALGNESVGRPRNPAFLLRRGELLSLVEDLRIIAFEDGFLTAPERFVQRIVAVREAGAGPLPPRWPLPSG